MAAHSTISGGYSRGVRVDIDTYMSGFFCVSITAAIGIPKFEAGPQKSGEREMLSAYGFPTVLGVVSGRLYE